MQDPIGCAQAATFFQCEAAGSDIVNGTLGAVVGVP